MRILPPTALALIFAAIGSSQMPRPPTTKTLITSLYRPIHRNRTVTFRLFAPKASEVVLMGSPGILAVIKKPMPLTPGEKGVWSLTVGPLPPSFYTYGYAIDGGLRMPDPSNSKSRCAAGDRRASSSFPATKKPLKNGQSLTERFK